MTLAFRKRRPPGADAAAQSPPDPELVAQRDRLTERFAVLQSQLGGLFYEMAIRDHVQMDVLLQKAADLQRLDAELGTVEQLLEGGMQAIGGHCGQCGAVYAPGAAYCGQCANPLTRK